MSLSADFIISIISKSVFINWIFSWIWVTFDYTFTFLLTFYEMLDIIHFTLSNASFSSSFKSIVLSFWVPR